MESFVNKIAVVTGGGTGMGRELVRQLAKDGCHVAMCDVIEENMHETYEIATKESPNVKISMHVCDVSIEDQVNQFKDEVLAQHDTDKINLLFNNAGIGGEVVLSKAAEKNGRSVLLYVGMVFITVLELLLITL